MHPDREIVRTYTWSDVVLTRPYGPNTLTRQSTATNDAPMDPPFCLRYMESCPFHGHATSTSTSTVPASLPPSQSPQINCRVMRPPIVPSSIPR